MGDGDDDQGEGEPERVAGSISDATRRDAGGGAAACCVPLRCGRAVEGAGKKFLY
jgi:hypothetical protein